MDTRYQTLLTWLNRILPTAPDAVEAVAGDASFRRYFRASVADQSWIIMDAPPQKEDCTAFIAIARHWHEQGLHVPEILATDLDQGFIQLEDLGDTLFANKLPEPGQADALYDSAMEALARIQTLPQADGYPLPPYDETLLNREMQLFPDWLLETHLGMELSSQERALLETTFSLLRESAMAQPSVTVHRDYHSRNLLVTDNNPGIIDFQDAVQGPVTYDLVSLLKDCYIQWPEEDVARWLEQFRAMSQSRGLHNADNATFTQWFELMGMQRHLKAAGIFARLAERDGKTGYLADIPRTVGYLITASARQPALFRFGDWLESRVMPRLQERAENPA